MHGGRGRQREAGSVTYMHLFTHTSAQIHMPALISDLTVFQLLPSLYNKENEIKTLSL